MDDSDGYEPDEFGEDPRKNIALRRASLQRMNAVEGKHKKHVKAPPLRLPSVIETPIEKIVEEEEDEDEKHYTGRKGRRPTLQRMVSFADDDEDFDERQRRRRQRSEKQPAWRRQSVKRPRSGTGKAGSGGARPGPKSGPRAKTGISAIPMAFFSPQANFEKAFKMFPDLDLAVSL